MDEKRRKINKFNFVSLRVDIKDHDEQDWSCASLSLSLSIQFLSQFNVQFQFRFSPFSHFYSPPPLSPATHSLTQQPPLLPLTPLHFCTVSLQPFYSLYCHSSHSIRHSSCAVSVTESPFSQSYTTKPHSLMHSSLPCIPSLHLILPRSHITDPPAYPISSKNSYTPPQCIYSSKTFQAVPSPSVRSSLPHLSPTNTRLLTSPPLPLPFFPSSPLCPLLVLISPTEANSLSSLQYSVTDRTGIPIEDQRLVFNGKQLMNSESLEAFGLVEGATVGLVLRFVCSSQQESSYERVASLTSTWRCARSD